MHPRPSPFVFTMGGKGVSITNGTGRIKRCAWNTHIAIKKMDALREPSSLPVEITALWKKLTEAKLKINVWEKSTVI